jgi:hypothetical protein
MRVDACYRHVERRAPTIVRARARYGLATWQTSCASLTLIPPNLARRGDRLGAHALTPAMSRAAVPASISLMKPMVFAPENRSILQR